jgi:hypothetical protein
MSTNETLQLQEPLTDGGIRAVNFFNGRLLTAKDLSREQQARREADWRLGLALGEGVAFGLGISRDQILSKTAAPVVRIEPGLAFNRQGQALRLQEPVSVALVRTFEGLTADCLFTACSPSVGGTYVAGAGFYILTLAPAQASEGRAADSGFDPANVRCNTDATVEAVQFRLLRIKPTAYADLDLADPALRNLIAYRCFGAGVQSEWFADLLGAAPRRDDLLETLRPSPLSDLDVPLALLYFTGGADLQFIDLWAVRRPPARTDSDGPLTGLADARRMAVGRAMFQQFQAQVADWASFGDLGSVTARTHCRYLPPVGIIPVAEETDGTDTQATRFFAGMTCRGPAFINAARLEALVRDGLCYPPVFTQGADLVWLYRVRENRHTIDLRADARPPRSYLVFASGHLPYCGDAEYALAHWGYSNYALVS